MAESWDRPYTREQGAFPAPWTHEHKYWPPVRRIDNAFGDRHGPAPNRHDHTNAHASRGN